MHIRHVVTATVVVLMVMAIAMTSGRSSGAAQTGTPDYVATISAQASEIVDLEATVKARGKKINVQRTQIANLKSTIEAMPVVPTETPQPDVTDPYIAQLLIDATTLLESCNSFDLQMGIAGGGGTADPATVFAALQTWHDMHNVYAGTIAPGQYTDIHTDWLNTVEQLDEAAYVFEAYLYGSGDDVAMENSMFSYLIWSKGLRDDLLPKIQDAQ